MRVFGFVLLLLPGIALCQPPDTDEKPEDHILGVVPNYNTVAVPKNVEPMTPGEKFKLASKDAFDPFAWGMTGVYAGVAQWHNQYPEWGQGDAAYGKRYGALFADQAVSTYLSESLFPTLLHEDPRFFRLGKGSFWKRTGYALSRVIVNRTDAGPDRFNNSEIEGNMIAAALGTLYYPASGRTVTQTIERFSVSVLSDAGFNVLKEFWPDMRRKVLKR